MNNNLKVETIHMPIPDEWINKMRYLYGMEY
jgi:hypothetical protein